MRHKGKIGTQAKSKSTIKIYKLEVRINNSLQETKYYKGPQWLIRAFKRWSKFYQCKMYQSEVNWKEIKP
jgi:hypothetical protein